MPHPIDILEISEDFSSEFDRMRVHEATVFPNEPAPLPRPSNQTEEFRLQFSLPWDEFEVMPKKEVWEYVNTMIRRLIIKAKSAAKEKGGKFRFYRFSLPNSTMNRRVITYEKNGVFVAMIAQRRIERVNKSRPDIGQDIINFTFQVKIGEI
jgi:hypothetical protein